MMRGLGNGRKSRRNPAAYGRFGRKIAPQPRSNSPGRAGRAIGGIIGSFKQF